MARPASTSCSIERTELARNDVAIFGRLRHFTPDVLADYSGFAHRGGTEIEHQRIGLHAVYRRAGDRRNRIDRHVAPELVPDVVADIRRYRYVEAGIAQQGAKPAGPFCHLSGRFSQNQPLPHLVLHKTRFAGERARMHDATNHMRERDVLRNAAAGVDTLQRLFAQARQALREPPRHAVHGRQDDRLRAQQRRDALRHRAQRRPLDRDDDDVLHAQYFRPVGSVCCRLQKLAALLQPPAVRAQRLQGGAARQRTDLALSFDGKTCADEAADGAGPEYAYFHDRICCGDNPPIRHITRAGTGLACAFIG